MPPEPTSPGDDEPTPPRVPRTSASSRESGPHAADAAVAADPEGPTAVDGEAVSADPVAAGVADDETEQMSSGAEGDGDSEGADVDPESAEGDGDPEGAAAEATPRKRRIVIAAAAVGVLVVVLVALALTRGSGQVDPITVVTITEEAVSPSPQTAPIERDTSTPLLEALPGTVLAYAVSEQTESEQMLAAHALEGWTLTYADADASIVLKVGQWPDGKEAKAAWDALIADAEPTASGDVVVGDDTVGGVVTVVDGEVERTIWRNRTAVFVAQGPVGATQAFFAGFPF